MKRYFPIYFLVVSLSYSQISLSVTNQELMDRLDDMEWEQQMRDIQRRSDREFDRIMNQQRGNSTTTPRTNPKDIFLKNHILVYSSQDERVYVNQQSNKTKDSSTVFYITEYLKPNYFDKRLRYTDNSSTINCVNNTIVHHRSFQLDENFNSIGGNVIPYQLKKIEDPIGKSLKTYICN